jgi:hypothetical protein
LIGIVFIFLVYILYRLVFQWISSGETWIVVYSFFLEIVSVATSATTFVIISLT